MTRRTCMNALKKYINRQKEYLTYPSTPVMDAWGFTTENYRIPAEDELSALLKNVDASKIQYDKRQKNHVAQECEN